MLRLIYFTPCDGVNISSVLSFDRSICSQHAISKKLKISRGVVQKCIARGKKNPLNKYVSRKWSGRPKVSSQKTDNSVRRVAKQSSRASSKKIKAQLPPEEKISE